MQNIISVKNLIFEYVQTAEDEKTENVFRAVDNVSFNIEKGSFVAVVGQNGSGKSTLAKNLNGLLVATSGKIYVNDMDTADDNLIWKIRQNIGMVFQNPDNQIVSSIVEDDVAFGPENLGIAPEEIRKRVDAALKAVDMYDCRKKAPHLLSGGQKQRISIAGVIAMRSECIVFDEPTAMLDPKGRQQVMAIIKMLHKEGITVILITHFMEEAAEAERILVMKEGKLISDSTPSELFSNIDLVRRTGLEVPTVVDLKNRLNARGINIPDNVITTEDMVNYICQ